MPPAHDSPTKCVTRTGRYRAIMSPVPIGSPDSDRDEQVAQARLVKAHSVDLLSWGSTVTVLCLQIAITSPAVVPAAALSNLFIKSGIVLKNFTVGLALRLLHVSHGTTVQVHTMHLCAQSHCVTAAHESPRPTSHHRHLPQKRQEGGRIVCTHAGIHALLLYRNWSANQAVRRFCVATRARQTAQSSELQHQ